ncbi:MAG TPA: DUF3800 domain-containing protein [Solirubrobacterales bacterium]|nr:DUF3800 domain-containing protein [Solirubrobacterales bacterium]
MDEAGNTGRRCDDPAQPIHLILTLVVDEVHVPVVHEHIRNIARIHCPSTCSDPDFEFHGQDLFSGRGCFEGVKPAKRIKVYDDVLKGIEASGAEVIIRGVEKTGLAQRYANPYHPHDIALMYTIESVERMARERGCRVLLVADEAKEIEDAALRDLANYQELGTSWGWKPEQIDRIVDTIHFVPSHRNGAIQLADCATFIAARVRKIDEGIVQAGASAEAVEKLWEERILPHVRTNEVWFPTL